MAHSQQNNIYNNNNNGNNNDNRINQNGDSNVVANVPVQEAIDAPSYSNKFGWEKIADNFGLPVIVRSSGIRYAPVRIVEQEIIKKYDCLPQELFKCITLRSFYITAVEAKLLNLINFNHCDHRYGELFFTTRDVIISAADVKELARFLELSNVVFTQDITKLSHRLGIVDVALDPKNSNVKTHVPFICKYVAGQDDLARFIPSTFLDPYVINVSLKSIPSEWDLLCMKMLCIYSGSERLSFLHSNIYIIPLDGLLYKSTRTQVIYEDYTPSKR